MPTAATDQGRTLWQYAFLWIGEASNLTVLHPLDIDRAKTVFSGLASVGDLPSDAEVKEFLTEAWGEPTADSQRQLRQLWRRVLANPRHRFRFTRKPSPGERFYVLDRKTEEHGLTPLEDRVRELASEALDDCARASDIGSVEEYRAAHDALEGALRSLSDLRRLRYGPSSIGGWWDDFEHDSPPPGTRGVISD